MPGHPSAKGVGIGTLPGVVFDPTQAFHAIRRVKTLARLMRGRVFPSHDPVFWQTVPPTDTGLPVTISGTACPRCIE